MHAQQHTKDLLTAMLRLEQVDVPEAQRTGPTMQHLRAAAPHMNEREFKVTMDNLRRRKLRIVNTIEVQHSCKPVAVFGLWHGDAPKTHQKWQSEHDVFAKGVQAV